MKKIFIWWVIGAFIGVGITVMFHFSEKMATLSGFVFGAISTLIGL